VVSLALSGCGRSAETKTEGAAPANGAADTASGPNSLTLAVIPKSTGGEFWETVEVGANDAAKELGVSIKWEGALTETEITELASGTFDGQLVADLQLFHALIGNWDYSLGWDSRGVWNTEVLELTDGTKLRLVPVAGDFDLASWVTGIARRSAPQDYHPELGEIEREIRYELEQIQQRVAPTMFLAARQRPSWRPVPTRTGHPGRRDVRTAPAHRPAQV
jgi:hypothetical protein